METKICTKCFTEKTSEEFYKHPSTKDGRDSKCKECAKKASDINFKRKIAELPGFLESEKNRAREKFHRLYKEVRPSPERHAEIMKEYKNRFPEKKLAQSRSGTLPKLTDRQQYHHWSYNKNHWKDCIVFGELEHRKLHRYMTYDQERMMYRTTSGVLLDTKGAHIKYYNSLKDLP